MTPEPPPQTCGGVCRGEAISYLKMTYGSGPTRIQRASPAAATRTSRSVGAAPGTRFTLPVSTSS